MTFKVGDVVVCQYPYDHDDSEYFEFIGTIVINSIHDIGVGVEVHRGTGHEYEDSLHSLDGSIDTNNGWWLAERKDILRLHEIPMLEYDPAQQGETDDDI